MTDNIKTLIAFSMLRNMNSGIAERLLSRLGSEEALLTMSSSELSALGRLPDYILDENYRAELKDRASRETDFIVANNVAPLYFSEASYPRRLRHCEDGPAMLYQLGNTNLDATHVVSIVGTRRATPHGIEITNRIVKDLSEKLEDLIIVSGLAYGIDVAAHKAALANNVPTVAVSAHPLNTIYPADHRGVAVKMLRNGGSIITEYTTSDTVHKMNFVARNRIIAGLADATIVIESDAKGGSLITAEFASEYNREVFAAPGRLTDKYSQGTNHLIETNRANMYTSVDRFLDIMGWTPKEDVAPRLDFSDSMTEIEQKIYNFLLAHPSANISELAIGTAIAHGQLKDILFDLEMRDLVLTIAGGRYSAISQ